MAGAAAAAEEKQKYRRHRKSEEIGKFVIPDARVHDWLPYLRRAEFRVSSFQFL
jgi:hypothetical protein